MESSENPPRTTGHCDVEVATWQNYSNFNGGLLAEWVASNKEGAPRNYRGLFGARRRFQASTRSAT